MRCVVLASTSVVASNVICPHERQYSRRCVFKRLQKSSVAYVRTNISLDLRLTPFFVLGANSPTHPSSILSCSISHI